MTERNPFYSVADLLGVNCADRTDKIIAEEMLTTLDHFWKRRPIDYEGQPVHLGAYEVDDCGDWVFCTVVGLAEYNRVVIDVPGYEHWQTINAHRIREAPGVDDFGNEYPRIFKKPDSWGDDIKAYVYLSDADKNENWPGISMTDNGDGTYSYNVDKHFMDGIDPKVVFNDGGKNQAPKSGGFIIKDGQEYDENYSD